MLQPEVYCPRHAKQYPCRGCGGTDKPVVSLGDEYGYEFCADCLRRFLGMVNQLAVRGGECDLCFSEREAAKEGAE